MALAVWGLEDLPEMELYELSYAYLRRQRFEAQVLATELARILVGSSRLRANTSAPQPQLVSADTFLAEAGMKLE